jgi:hypothetical protein
MTDDTLITKQQRDALMEKIAAVRWDELNPVVIAAVLYTVAQGKELEWPQPPLVSEFVYQLMMDTMEQLAEEGHFNDPGYGPAVATLAVYIETFEKTHYPIGETTPEALTEFRRHERADDDGPNYEANP